jgi:hypothetical protein
MNVTISKAARETVRDKCSRMRSAFYTSRKRCVKLDE